MRHSISGRQLGRTTAQRRALFRSLAREFILRGRIKTTQAKAKSIKVLIDKLVTKAKKATIASRREILAILPKDAALLLIDTIVPRLAHRTSGYSRILHLEGRNGDNAEMVLMEWTDEFPPKAGPPLAEKVELEKEESKVEKKKTVSKRKVVKKV